MLERAKHEGHSDQKERAGKLGAFCGGHYMSYCRSYTSWFVEESGEEILNITVIGPVFYFNKVPEIRYVKWNRWKILEKQKKNQVGGHWKTVLGMC